MICPNIAACDVYIESLGWTETSGSDVLATSPHVHIRDVSECDVLMTYSYIDTRDIYV